jgi:hypothetical protein
MSDIQSVDQALSEAAQSGVEYASQTFGVTLDYSEASIQQVEGILSRIYDSIPRGFLAKLTKKAPTPKDLERIGFMFGGYIGEVIKRHFGGRWKMESSLYQGQKVLTFELVGGGELWPQMKVGKRLQNGPEDNVWHYYQVLRQRFQEQT